MSDFPNDRRYTMDHEWASTDGSRIRIGITQHAVDQLGDITLVNFDVAAGDSVSAGKAFGTVESVKAVSDLYAPVAGKIVEVNALLHDSPEALNEDCYGKAWMIVIEVSNASELEALMNSEAYSAHVAASDH